MPGDPSCTFLLASRRWTEPGGLCSRYLERQRGGGPWDLIVGVAQRSPLSSHSFPPVPVRMPKHLYSSLLLPPLQKCDTNINGLFVCQVLVLLLLPPRHVTREVPDLTGPWFYWLSQLGAGGGSPHNRWCFLALKAYDFLFRASYYISCFQNRKISDFVIPPPHKKQLPIKVISNSRKYLPKGWRETELTWYKPGLLTGSKLSNSKGCL